MMKKTNNFDDILDECLERVLIMGETVEQCLAEYPDHTVELEPLLRTALVARKATAIKPRPEFRAKASYQFQAALQDMETKKSRGFLGWQPRWATAVIVVIVLLLAGGGTVASASNSMPDEPLYQVKLATEAVRLTLTPSALGKAELYVKLADKRVAEIIKMAEKGKTEQVERATQRLNSQLIAMASLPVAGKEEPMEGEIAEFKVEQPQQAAEEAPPAVVPAPERAEVREAAPLTEPEPEPSPMLAPVPEEEAPVAAAPRAPGPPENAEKGRGVVKDDKGAKPDKQMQLKKDLSRRAIQNQDALRAVLDRVPESVKPALRQAIKAAGAGYEQALRNLD